MVGRDYLLWRFHPGSTPKEPASGSGAPIHKMLFEQGALARYDQTKAPPGKPGANAALKDCRERLRSPTTAQVDDRRPGHVDLHLHEAVQFRVPWRRAAWAASRGAALGCCRGRRCRRRRCCVVRDEDGDDASDFLVLDAPPSLKVVHSDACQNDTSPPERHLAARVLDAVRLLQKEEVREEGAGAVAREEYAAEVNVGASTLGHGWCYRSPRHA